MLAISGTAAVVGHASAHAGDIDAQLAETLRNLETLLDTGGMPRGFGPHAPLKVYVRRPEDEETVRGFRRDALRGRSVVARARVMSAVRVAGGNRRLALPRLISPTGSAPTKPGSHPLDAHQAWLLEKPGYRRPDAWRRPTLSAML